MRKERGERREERGERREERGESLEVPGASAHVIRAVLELFEYREAMLCFRVAVIVLVAVQRY